MDYNSNSIGLMVPFMTSQNIHIGTGMWDTLMSNYISQVTNTPFTLSGPGIVGVLHMAAYTGTLVHSKCTVPVDVYVENS